MIFQRVVAEVVNVETGSSSNIRLGRWRDVWTEGVSIGSGPNATIKIDSPAISRLQARVTRLGHHHFVEVLGGPVSCAGRSESTAGASWRISGIGDPEPIKLGAFEVTIRTARTFCP